MGPENVYQESEESQEPSDASGGEDSRSDASGHPEEQKPSSNETPGDADGQETAPEPTAQLKELVDAIDNVLKDNNPLTLLVVFVLGLVFGRLFSR